jgi:hypothetical protein
MNETAHVNSWTTKRFWRVIMLVFLAQFILIFLLSERGPIAKPEVISPTFFRLLAKPVTDSEVLESIFASDPTLFVLPGRNGFSGMAWLNPKTAQYAPPQWDEPARFLAINTDTLGQTILDEAKQSSLPAVQIDERFAEVGSTLPLATKPLRPSSLRVEGEIRGRFISVSRHLRSWERPEVLGDSTVRVAVNGAGNVVTALLLQPGSGWRAADEEALEIARSAKFQPVNTGSMAANLAWGTMVFRWQTVPVPETNAVNTVTAP